MAKTEGQYPGEFILSEAPGTLSRETVTVTAPASTKLQPGHVLGKLTATGKYVPYDNAGSDGSEDAAAILYTECDNSEVEEAADFEAVVVVRAAEVRKAALQWNAGMVSGDKTAAYTDLAASHVIARD
jgi:hypothetical protein